MDFFAQIRPDCSGDGVLDFVSEFTEVILTVSMMSVCLWKLHSKLTLESFERPFWAERSWMERLRFK